METQIVLIAGQKRAGKDLFASMLKIYIEASSPDVDVIIFSFADALKKAAQIIFDLSDSQLWGDDKDVHDPRWDCTPRKLLQLLGTEVSRQIHPNVWILKLRELVRTHSTNHVILIPDVRFKNEALTPIEWFGSNVSAVHITRPSIIGAKDLHASENDSPFKDWPFTQDPYRPLVEIYNDGTQEDLANQVSQAARLIYSCPTLLDQFEEKK